MSAGPGLGECVGCAVEVDEDGYCYGCGAHICDTCNRNSTDLVPNHNPEDHTTEPTEEEE